MMSDTRVTSHLQREIQALVLQVAFNGASCLLQSCFG
jgi:hypothetical protein